MLASGFTACELFFPLAGYAGDGGSGGGSGGGTAGGLATGGGAGFDAGPPRGLLFCGDDGGRCIGGQQRCCTGNSFGAFWNSDASTCLGFDVESCPTSAVWLECNDSDNCAPGQFCCLQGQDAGTFASTRCEASSCGPSGPPLCKADGGGLCPGGLQCGGPSTVVEGVRECVP